MKRVFLILFGMLLLAWGFYPQNLKANEDSLKVLVIDTPIKVSKIRYIERDQSTLLLRVMDESGQAFRELETANVTISRGEEQAKIDEVTSLQTLERTNLNLVLALDNSASMNRSSNALLQSVNLLLTTLRNRCQVSLIFFDDNDEGENFPSVSEKQLKIKTYPFATDINQLMKTSRIRYNDGHMSRRTYLYDEILVGLEQFKKLPENLLRAMVVFSDGADLGSVLKFEEVVAAVKAAGITIYAIDYSRISDYNQDLEKIALASPEGRIYKAKRAEDLLPLFDALSRELITEFQVTYHFPVPPTGTIKFDGDSLTITERKIVDEFPLLNYVFFDSAEAKIDRRYHRFTASEETTGFNEETIAQSLEKYYHVLNIIGSRAQQYPQSQLTLTGCNMNLGAEKGNLTLSKERAMAVKKYLEEVWGISAERLIIKQRNLPTKSSGSRSQAGQAENRRVEITSADYNMTRPVRSEITEFVYQPEIGYFNAKVEAHEGLKHWEFIAQNGGQALTQMKFDEVKPRFSWNWINATGAKLNTLENLTYRIKIEDNDGEIFESELQTIPITQHTFSTSKVKALQDTLFQKFSLILFDFNSSTLGTANQNLMQKVLNVYLAHPQAKFRIFGFCDDIGSEDYNLKLSTTRAKMAYNSLVRMGIPQSQVSYLGYGELNPIFSNSSPEGRFLNRTVQIEIRYPNDEFAEK